MVYLVGGDSMNLTAVWFVINIFFVASFIVTLFAQRTFSVAALEQSNPQKINRFRKIRNLFVVITIVLFIAMSAAFLSNMRLNG
jgi:sterol desaturase/sphingolipid hydroxylase (fatty acid hydroxylase superfamily)